MGTDISWLLEPHTHTMFMQFPLPLAIIGHDGQVKQLNHCFNKSFEADCLNPENLQKIFQESNGDTNKLVPIRCGQCSKEVFVRVVNVSDSTILVMDKSVEDTYGKELEALHKRLLELEKISVSDRLTGAWNRTHFDRIIPIELARSLRYRQPISLLFLDIDHFKQVNDTFGHLAGDQVLCQLVNVVGGNIRASDMLFRWGGEEFVILMTSTSYSEAGFLAEELRRKVAGHDIEGVGRITISLGVAEYLSDESEARWFQRADQALYLAKDSGRNQVMIDKQGNSDLWEKSDNSSVLHLSWHDSYNCGQPVIDAEHQKLFDLANTLIGAAFRRSEHPQDFDQAMTELLSHVVKHFADEEAILAEHHYPGLALHAIAHKQLVERALELRGTAVAGGITIGELVDFLADEVVARHMLKTDREFYPLFAKTQGCAPT